MFRGVQSVSDARGTTLAGWTLALKDVCSVRAVDMAATDRQAQQSIGELAVISSGDLALASAKLVVAIDVADPRGFRAPTFEEFHCCSSDG